MFNRPMTAATRTSAQPVPGLDYFTDAPIQPAPVADMPAPAQDALHAALDQMFGYYA